MSSVRCVSCDSRINQPENSSVIESSLTNDEIEYHLRNIEQNKDSIKSCICVSCADKYSEMMEEQVKEMEKKSDVNMRGLGNLIMDLNNSALEEKLKQRINAGENSALTEEINALEEEAQSQLKMIEENKSKILELEKEEEELNLRINLGRVKEGKAAETKEKIIKKINVLQCELNQLNDGSV